MKTLDAKAAVDRESEKLETLPAWQVTKVKSKTKVIRKAQQEGETVHFATLMVLYHLITRLFKKFKRSHCTPM